LELSAFKNLNRWNWRSPLSPWQNRQVKEEILHLVFPDRILQAHKKWHSSCLPKDVVQL